MMELLSGSLPLFEFIIAFVFVLRYCDMANKLLSLSMRHRDSEIPGSGSTCNKYNTIFVY